MNNAIPIDIDGLDNLLQPHHLIVIAGRYGHGADIMAAQIARCAAVEHGVPTVFASCRSDENQITARLVSAQAGVDLMHIRRDVCTDPEESRIAEVGAALSAAPLFINTDCTFASVARHITKTRARLAVVEDAHLLIADDSFGESSPNAEERALDLSRDLKLLARRIEIPVVVTVPLLARDDRPAGQPPAMNDLGDCWSFAGDADALVMTYRPDLIEGFNRPGEIDLIVAKNRHGAATTMTAWVQEQYHRIVDFPGAGAS